MRTSIAWPAHGDVRPGASASGSPPAIRIISRTRSTPVTISVTGCSTWMRVFISMKKKSPAVVVVEIFERAGAAVADRFGKRARRRRRASRARSRSSDGDGASSQTFWRRRCSEHSRSKQWTTSLAVAEHLHLDVAGALDEASRDRGRRRRRRPAPRRCACGISRSSSAASSATRMPRPPPPAAALIITGKPIVAAPRRSASSGSVDAPVAARHGRHAGACAAAARRRPCRPSVRIVSRRGPTKTSPAASTAAAKLGILGQKAVARMDGVGAGLARRGEDRVDVEIGLRRRAAGRSRPPRRPCAPRGASLSAVAVHLRPCAARARVAARMMRTAISPRLAMRSVSNRA